MVLLPCVQFGIAIKRRYSFIDENGERDASRFWSVNHKTRDGRYLRYEQPITSSEYLSELPIDTPKIRALKSIYALPHPLTQKAPPEGLSSLHLSQHLTGAKNGIPAIASGLTILDATDAD